MNKLILFVTEACNLRCKYCYLRESDTHQFAILSKENARKIARIIFRNKKSCNFVQFFGGEPTLNLPAIISFITEVQHIVEEGKLKQMPQFGIVTNGSTKYSSDMICLCSKYNIRVTVSLDGNKRIHDILRPNYNGAGTYDKVINTIENLHRSKVPVAIESVYTTLHIKNEYSIVELIQFIQSLGVTKLIFHTAYPPAPQELCPFTDPYFDKLLKYHIDGINWWFENLIDEKSSFIDIYFNDLLLPLLYGAGAGVSGNGCPAGINDFSISPSGDIYSCHLLYKIPQYFLGNILQDDCWSRERNLPTQTKDIPKCTDCFARYWCQPCGALNLNWGNLWVPPKRECILRRTVLFTIGELAFNSFEIPSNSITDVLRYAIENSLKDQV